MKMIKRAMILSGIFFIASCSSESEEKKDDTPVSPLPTIVKYTADVKPIIENNCITCHKTGGAANFLPLNSYNAVKNAIENNNLLTRINDPADPMPRFGLMIQEKRDIIQKWKDDGFQE
jgi:hypothetical protein